MHEQVSDVMFFDHWASNADHRCSKLFGETVDVKTAIYTNRIGDALIMV